MARVYKFDSLRDCARACINAGALAGKHIAFGVFDGVHAGHVSLINKMLRYAKNSNTAILTFDKDPDEVLFPEKTKKLMSNTARLQTLSRLPVESVFALPFTREFAALEPEVFLRELLDDGKIEGGSTDGECAEGAKSGAGALNGAGTLSSTAPASIHVGAGFRFGARAAGDINLMRTWARDCNSACKIFEVPLLQLFGAPVSSTRIRGLLARAGEACAAVPDNCSTADLLANAGEPCAAVPDNCSDSLLSPRLGNNTTFPQTNLDLANTLLGHAFSVQGEVREGRHDGATFGFATANLHIAPEFDVLQHGVYAAYAHIEADSNHIEEGFKRTEGNLKTYKAAVSVGTSPTFEQAKANVEAHILDFEGNLYGKTITLEFARYLRPMKKFENTQDLIDAISTDVEQVSALPVLSERTSTSAHTKHM